MGNVIIQLPFESYEKKGLIEIDYRENTSPVLSGFEIVKHLIPDLSVCLGFPMVHAAIKAFEGFSFLKSSAWIQILTMEVFNTIESIQADEIIKHVDIPPIFEENKVPFFAYGCPAEIFDAP